jgi:hypothetical protein
MIEFQTYNEKRKFIDELSKHLGSTFGISGIEKQKVKKQLQVILDKFIDDVFIIVEYPYVDKYYRDTYYNFFSKKHAPHQRDSVRVSFFYNRVQLGDFVNEEKIKEIQNAFLGVLTIRPTSFRVIGHTFLSPEILKDKSFVSCLCNERVSIGGIELSLYGFPFCSQDNESITCAESALLMLVNYYSGKFSDYSRLLPSKINEILKNLSIERQLPSIGLDYQDISFVLKELGFAPKIYVKSCLEEEEQLFKRALYTYIESGIPVILILEKDSGNRHAIVAMGREKVMTGQVSEEKFTDNRVHFSDIFDKILVMDDNSTPYELVEYNHPCKYDESYQIKVFIVPLYNKIYSDASSSLSHFDAIILEFSKDKDAKKVLHSKKQKCIIRYYLTTSRSYKSYIVASKGFTPEFKAFFIDQSMPKFIWVAEIINGDRLNAENQMVDTVVILDATESGFSGNLIIAFNSQNLVLKNFVNGEKLYSTIEMNIGTFSIFCNNLKGQHTRWQSQNY